MSFRFFVEIKKGHVNFKKKSPYIFQISCENSERVISVLEGSEEDEKPIFEHFLTEISSSSAHSNLNTIEFVFNRNFDRSWILQFYNRIDFLFNRLILEIHSAILKRTEVSVSLNSKEYENKAKKGIGISCNIDKSRFRSTAEPLGIEKNLFDTPVHSWVQDDFMNLCDIVMFSNTETISEYFIRYDLVRVLSRCLSDCTVYNLVLSLDKNKIPEGLQEIEKNHPELIEQLIILSKELKNAKFSAVMNASLKKILTSRKFDTPLISLKMNMKSNPSLWNVDYLYIEILFPFIIEKSISEFTKEIEKKMLEKRFSEVSSESMIESIHKEIGVRIDNISFKVRRRKLSLSITSKSREFEIIERDLEKSFQKEKSKVKKYLDTMPNSSPIIKKSMDNRIEKLKIQYTKKKEEHERVLRILGNGKNSFEQSELEFITSKFRFLEIHGFTERNIIQRIREKKDIFVLKPVLILLEKVKKKKFGEKKVLFRNLPKVEMFDDIHNDIHLGKYQSILEFREIGISFFFFGDSLVHIKNNKKKKEQEEELSSSSSLVDIFVKYGGYEVVIEIESFVPTTLKNRIFSTQIRNVAEKIIEYNEKYIYGDIFVIEEEEEQEEEDNMMIIRNSTRFVVDILQSIGFTGFHTEVTRYLKYILLHQKEEEEEEEGEGEEFQEEERNNFFLVLSRSESDVSLFSNNEFKKFGKIEKKKKKKKKKKNENEDQYPPIFMISNLEGLIEFWEGREDLRINYSGYNFLLNSFFNTKKKNTFPTK